MDLATSTSSAGDIEELTVLVGEEDWSSTNTLAKADVEALFALIECAVCVAFLQDAHECTTCHALFCKGCIASWVRTARTCPCCRHASAEADFVPNVVIQRFLDGMSVECPHAGCQVRPSRVELDAHVAACSFSPARLQTQRTQLRQAVTARTASVEAAFKNNSATVDDLTGLARELLAASDHAAALVWAERAKAKFPAAQAADEAVADALFAAGQWSRALPHYQAAQLHRPLAQCHLKLGHYDEAEKALLEVLRRDTNDVGTLCSLGALKKKQNAYGDARRYLEDALKLVPFGGKPWLEASMSLADCLRKTENYEESKRLYVKVLKRAEVEYGKRSAQVAAALNALGMLTKKLGQYAQAQKYYKAAIKLKVALCGGSFNHAEVAEYMANLGDVMRKESNFAQAEALYVRAVAIFEATVGAKHIDLADVLNSLGLVKKKWGDYDQAAVLYDRALSICEETFPAQPHYKKGIYLNNRADVERKRGHYDRALDMYKQSLDMLRVTVGPMHSECADPLHATGLVLHQLGKYQDAVESITQALKIVEREFGKNHYKYGVFLNSSGLAKAMLNDIDGAYKDLKQALQTLIQSLGATHIEVADVYSALADVCLKLYAEGNREPARLQEAKKYVTLAREIIVAKFSPQHSKAQQCDSLLFICDNINSL